MNSFMQISRIISQSSEKVVVVTVSDKSNRDLTSEIDRLEKYVKTLEKISKKYNTNVESDFIKIYDLIQNYVFKLIMDMDHMMMLLMK